MLQFLDLYWEFVMISIMTLHSRFGLSFNYFFYLDFVHSMSNGDQRLRLWLKSLNIPEDEINKVSFFNFTRI